jgi:PP-loop superfamily ATP-utilizing enzyme
MIVWLSSSRASGYDAVGSIRRARQMTRSRPLGEQVHDMLDRSPLFQFARGAKAARDSALRFEVEADCLCPVTYVELAKQIAQMKFNRIDRHAEFSR